MASLLIVDDDEGTLAWMSAALAGLGHDVRAFRSGREAIAALANWRPDLIVADILMPEMDGLGLLRAVRGHAAIRKLPFILLTGRGDRELVVKAAQAGVNNYLVKPFTTATLRDKIEAVIGKLT